MKKQSKGVIYVLTNPAFPEYVKIGYADDLEKRLKHLNRSECLPFAFRVYCVYEVNERLKDKDVHALIDKLNPSLRAIDSFDGKTRTKEFYSMSAEDAYEILESISGVSGTKGRLKRMKPEGHEILDEEEAEEAQNNVIYTEEGHIQKCNPVIKEFYFKLKEKILDLGDVELAPKKLYLSFKGKRNICDFVFKREKIKITINLKIGELKDPKDLAINVKGKGHWGVGEYRLIIFGDEDLNDVMDIIKQSYAKNRIRIKK